MAWSGLAMSKFGRLNPKGRAFRGNFRIFSGASLACRNAPGNEKNTRKMETCPEIPLTKWNKITRLFPTRKLLLRRDRKIVPNMTVLIEGPGLRGSAVSSTRAGLYTRHLKPPCSRQKTKLMVREAHTIPISTHNANYWEGSLEFWDELQIPSQAAKPPRRCRSTRSAAQKGIPPAVMLGS